MCSRIIAAEMRKKGVEIRKRMGLQYWRSSLSWIQLPIFLLFIETIRRMCDTRGGLLGLIMKAPDKDAMTRSEMAHTYINPCLESGLATEGALWFPDLLAPDPMLILPFALSASLFGNLLLYDAKAKANGIPIGKWQLRFQRTLKLMALGIGPATLAMPSGMLIYWISSSLCALGQHALLEWYIPGRPIITPCKSRNLVGSR